MFTFDFLVSEKKDGCTNILFSQMFITLMVLQATHISNKKEAYVHQSNTCDAV